MSQCFTRRLGLPWDVSLRDVSRCLRLVAWFEGNMRNRPRPQQQPEQQPQQQPQRGSWPRRGQDHRGVWGMVASLVAGVRGSVAAADGGGDGQLVLRVQFRALVLALAHTYMSRWGRAHYDL